MIPRRTFLQLLGLAPVMPIAARLPVLAPDPYRCVITPCIRTYTLKSISWETYLAAQPVPDIRPEDVEELCRIEQMLWERQS